MKLEELLTSILRKSELIFHKTNIMVTTWSCLTWVIIILQLILDFIIGVFEILEEMPNGFVRIKYLNETAGMIKRLF